MKQYITYYNDIKPYTTKDGSIIRELMHPDQHICKNMSLAEATINPGDETLTHIHEKSEELYYILSGKGLMCLGDKAFEVEKGATICIPPNTSHSIKNNGTRQLKILCCCAPNYTHADTKLI